MIQRMIFATIVAAYARMKSITDHSFEGVAYGAKSQQKFMSENLKRLRAFILHLRREALATAPLTLWRMPLRVTRRCRHRSNRVSRLAGRDPSSPWC